ncbi:unnamed protein product [Spirodela intermedia]|uniref:Cell wall hydroxyproline-rich glycoprotein n=1 Tax=Spirodela intermedia TaxID=51605 RepID=A0A7I8J7L4_SPIIN|nr:unnamed protein product [Spirodela intermedia]CAA6666069.1 unnamed protein product [Spirodela intermedia]
MPTGCCLPLLFFFLVCGEASPQASAFVGFGNGGGLGVWVNGGVGVSTQNPPPGGSSEPSSSGEYAALQAFKFAITGDPSGVLANWVGPNVCSYRGVFCSTPPADDMPFSPSSPGRVVSAIDLNKANLQGTLVKELALLTHLSILHLNSNRFSGTVPDAFRDLEFLTEIDLSNNHFSGLSPNPFCTCRAWSTLTSDSTGEIPMSLWSSSASVISLANNRLTGSIPASFGYTGSGIRELLFLNNKLTGCIPEGVGLLSDIEVLDLSFNSLKGHLPSSLSCLSSIEVLNIAHNELSGVLPDVVCSMRSLLNLTISYNFFSGFSQDCGKTFRSAWFDFSGNCIPGRDLQRPPPECIGVSGDGLSCLRVPPRDPWLAVSPWALVSGSESGFPLAIVKPLRRPRALLHDHHRRRHRG